MTDTKPCKHCGYARHKFASRSLCNNCIAIFRKVAERAHHAVAIAIQAQKLLPPETLKCTDCDKPATCYDHRDYDKPLDVAPVCNRCNTKRGPAKVAFWHFVPRHIQETDSAFSRSMDAALRHGKIVARW